MENQMTQKLAKKCADCFFLTYDNDCQKGHSPRKYKDGLKRVCEDFSFNTTTVASVEMQESLLSRIKALFGVK
jgi:hypothetical protein